MFSLGKRRLLISCLLAFGLTPGHAQNPGTPGGQYRTAGTVVSSADGHPLARARITLSDVRNSGKPLSVLSAEDGSFAFSGLAAGKFSLQGAKRGYPVHGYEQHDSYWSAIVTGAGVDTEHLVLRLVPDAYIYGKVLDENGDPVRHATVRLYRVAHEEGSGRILPNRQAITDDLGAFEIGPDTAGTYFLMTQGEPWYAVHAPTRFPESPNALPAQVDPALDAAYPPTYYNDTTDPESATPIQVRGGERVQVEIHLAPVHSVHLLVHVPEGNFPQLQQSGLGTESSGVQANAQQVAPGLWELSGVAEGKYKLSINGISGQMQIDNIVAASQAQEIDASAPETAATVNVAAEVIGENGLPPQLTIGLRVPGGMLRSWDTADSKGIAHLNDVPAGRYEVVGWTNTRGLYSVSRVAVSGGELSGRTVTVGAGATVDAAVIFIRGQATVEGTVVRKGKPLAGAMVVLVPTNADERTDLFRRDQSDLDGTFSVRGVVPGNYTLVAIEDGWDLQWSRPEVINRYLSAGQPIEIPQGSTSIVKANRPVQAQSK